MKKPIFFVLLFASIVFAGKYQFASGPCTLTFDTKTSHFSFNNSCFAGDGLFKLECRSFLHPKEVHHITFTFSNKDIELKASTIEYFPVDYSLSAFGKDLENRKISLCQIAYKAYPMKIQGQE